MDSKGDGQGQARAKEPARNDRAERNDADLVRAVEKCTAAVTRHTDEFAERLFGDNPTSLQSQITRINESAFGDNPTSLRSRITEQEKDNAVSRGRITMLVAIITALGTFFALKFQTIAGWLGFVPRHSPLPMIFYGKVARFNAAMGRYWDGISLAVLCLWPRAVWLARKFWG